MNGADIASSLANDLRQIHRMHLDEQGCVCQRGVSEGWVGRVGQRGGAELRLVSDQVGV